MKRKCCPSESMFLNQNSFSWSFIFEIDFLLQLLEENCDSLAFLYGANVNQELLDQVRTSILSKNVELSLGG